MLYFVIWLIGYFTSYGAWLWFLKWNDDYTIRVRARNLAWSLLSWVSFVALIVVLLVMFVMYIYSLFDDIDWDEDASW